MLFAEEIRWPSLMGLMIFLTTDFSDGGDDFLTTDFSDDADIFLTTDETERNFSNRVRFEI